MERGIKNLKLPLWLVELIILDPCMINQLVSNSALESLPNARQVVMTAGNPSGIAATASATAILK